MRALFNIVEIVLYGFGLNAMVHGDMKLYLWLVAGLVVCFIKNRYTKL